MRVLIATGLFPPDIGGPATYSALLLEELPKRGLGVSLAAFGRVRHFPKVIRHLVYFFHLLISGASVDIIYAQDTMSVGWPAYLSSIFLRKKFVVRVPGDHIWEQGVQRFNISQRLDDFPVFSFAWHPYLMLLRGLQLLVVRGARRVVVPSNYLKSLVEKWGVPADRIITINNSYTPASNLEDKETLRKRLGLGGTVLVSVGRLVSWKGFAALIELIPALERFYPDVRLFIIGEGPERSVLDKKIRSAHLEERVHLLGKLPQPVMLNYVRAADLFVLNTSYEGFSHQLLEVMSLKTPLVTTEVGGNPEVVTAREHGLLVPYNDKAALLGAIKEILGDSVLRASLADKAFESLSRFEEKALLDALVRELKNL